MTLIGTNFDKYANITKICLIFVSRISFMFLPLKCLKRRSLSPDICELHHDDDQLQGKDKREGWME